VFAKYTVPALLLCSLNPKFFALASADGGLRPPGHLPGLCPWTPLGDFRPPDPAPHYLNRLQCKLLGTPMPAYSLCF